MEYKKSYHVIKRRVKKFLKKPCKFFSWIAFPKDT